ncbi:MAG: GxGYxYP family putative glycoside hydrolase [Thermoguttaceae bacterium]|nr:GxGYxYP family putative glycoside hydrolase [Thermoguttaceae bacterium]
MVIYDLTPTSRIDRTDSAARRAAWDEATLVSSLQGIVNRHAPRLYLDFVQSNGISVDRFWLQTFSDPQAAPDTAAGWLATRSRIEIHQLSELLANFRPDFDGVVIYDERVPATSNLAATIAGVENLLPLRYDSSPHSLYTKLVLSPDGPRLPVKRRLLASDDSPMFTGTGKIPGTELDSTGSAKTDAYLWLIKHYIEPGRCDTTHVGYYLDAWWLDHTGPSVQNHTLTNHDFVIAHRGFFFDLDPWEDETPVDDPTQPLGADGRMFRQILQAAYDRTVGKEMIHVAGFTPWDTKYTNYGTAGGTHEPVPTEWHHAEVLSAYNAYMDADALGLSAMANASFFMHFPLKERYPQRKPTLETLREKGYLDAHNQPIDRTFVSIYVGDYDSAAWVYQQMPHLWNDPARGSIPMGWAINPNLADRFGAGMDWLRSTATANDFFVSGDSGAGYINPMNLVEPRPFSGLPSGLTTWIEHCERYYRQWDLSITGFIIDGYAPKTDEAMRRAYATFSPEGVVLHQATGWGMTDQQPWIQMQYDLYEVDAGASQILSDVRADGTQFLMYRTILWSPSKLRAMFEKVNADPKYGQRIEFVDPYTLFLLMRQAATDTANTP